MNQLKNIILKVYENQRVLLPLIFLFSILASAAFLIFLGGVGPVEHGVPGTDYSSCYAPFTKNILEGKGILVGNNSHICGVPGFPIYLAIVFSFSNLLGINELTMIVFFNIIMVAIAVCLLFLIVDLIFDRTLALISTFLWMTYPFSLWFIKNPNSEIPFIPVLFLGIWLYLLALKKNNHKILFISAIILGLSVLVRPIAFFILFLLALLIFYLAKKELFKKKFYLAAIFLTIALLPVLIWEAAIVSKTGQFIFLTSDGTDPVSVGLTYAISGVSAKNRLTVPADVLALMQKTKAADLNTMAKVAKFCLHELINKPVTFSKLMFFKVVRSWFATGQMWWEDKILAVQLIYLLPAPFGVAILLKKYKEKKREIVFLLAIIFYFWAITILALSILRYMVPAMAFVITFSAATLEWVIYYLFKKFKKNEVE